MPQKLRTCTLVITKTILRVSNVKKYVKLVNHVCFHDLIKITLNSVHLFVTTVYVLTIKHKLYLYELYLRNDLD